MDLPAAITAVRVALATFSGMPDGWDDDLALARVLDAEFVVWDDPRVDWRRDDRVVIRSTWDFTHDVDAFLAWCDRVGPGRLRNRPALVRWNADKRYLADLTVPTVPTTFVGPGRRCTS